MIILIVALCSCTVNDRELPEEELNRAVELIQSLDVEGWSDWKEPDAIREELVGMGPQAIPILYRHLDHKNPRVRRWCEAAISGMVATSDNTSYLEQVAILDVLSSRKQSPEARLFAVQLAIQFNSNKVRSALANLLEHDELKLAVVKSLGMIGDHSVVSTIKASYENGNIQYRVAALKALGYINDQDVAGFMIDALNDPSFQIRKTAVSILGETGDLDVVSGIKPALNDENPEVREESARSIYRIACRQKNQTQQSEADQILMDLLPVVESYSFAMEIHEKLRNRGVDADHLFPDFQYINDWMIIGPFANVKWRGYHTIYPPENEIDFDRSYQALGKDVRWESITTDDEAGRVNLVEILSPAINVVAYATTTVNVSEDMKAFVKMGSDDSIKIWLNGEGVYSTYWAITRELVPDSDVFEVNLKKGENVFLLKICQGKRDWGFSMRLVDSQGNPITQNQELKK